MKRARILCLNLTLNARAKNRKTPRKPYENPTGISAPKIAFHFENVRFLMFLWFTMCLDRGQDSRLTHAPKCGIILRKQRKMLVDVGASDERGANAALSGLRFSPCHILSQIPAKVKGNEEISQPDGYGFAVMDWRGDTHAMKAACPLLCFNGEARQKGILK